MKASLRDRRFTLAGLCGVLCLVGAGPLFAGLLATDRTLPNFSFKDGQVDYWPDSGRSVRIAGGAGSLAGGALDLAGDAGSAEDPLDGSLHLGERPDDSGHLGRAPFNRFGSLPTAQSLSDGDLLAGTAKALRADSRTRDFAPLLDPLPVAGPLANRYRGAGIFLVAAGVDETTWIRGYKDAASFVRLVSLEGGTPSGPTPVPAPSSLALLALGLPILIRRGFRARFKAG